MDILVLGAAPVRPTDTPAQVSTLGLQLTEGQLIRATVQRSTDSLVWLSVGGRTLAARSQLPLRPGQEMTLQVAEIGANRITLRPIVSDAASLSLTTSTANGFEVLLTGWGLDADAINLALTRALLTEQGSVNRFDVQALRTLWNRLAAPATGSSTHAGAGPAEPDHSGIRALTTLYVNQLPITPETLTLARTWVDGLPRLAHSLADLENALTDAIGQLRASGQHTLAVQGLTADLERALQRTALWPVPLDASATIVARRLSASLSAAGIPQDAVLSETMNLSALLRRVTSGQGTLSPTDVEMLLKVAREHNTDDPGRWLQHLMSKLDGFLRQTAADSGLAHSLARLQGQIERVATDLASIQLMNSGHSGAEAAYLFPLPMTTPDGPSTAYLKVYRRNEHTDVDPQNVRLALLFNLPDLGEMTFNLSISERRLNGQILASRERTHELALEHLSDLRTDLGQLGYQVEGLTCGKLAAAPTANNDLPAVTVATCHVNLKA